MTSFDLLKKFSAKHKKHFIKFSGGQKLGENLFCEIYNTNNVVQVNGCALIDSTSLEDARLESLKVALAQFDPELID